MRSPRFARVEWDPTAGAVEVLHGDGSIAEGHFVAYDPITEKVLVLMGYDRRIVCAGENVFIIQNSIV